MADRVGGYLTPGGVMSALKMWLQIAVAAIRSHWLLSFVAVVVAIFVLMAIIRLPTYCSVPSQSEEGQNNVAENEADRTGGDQRDANGEVDYLLALRDEVDTPRHFQEPKQEPGNWRKAFICDIKITDALIALFTIGLAIFTAGLWRSTNKLWAAGERQFDLGRKEFVASHRPKIILREAYIGTHLGGEPIAVFYRLSNVGEGEATIVRSSIIVEANRPGKERPYFGPTSDMGNMIGPYVLYPGDSILLGYTSPHMKWDSNKHSEEAIRMGRGTEIHFAGSLAYRDGHGLVRMTAFRRILKPQRQRFYRIEGEPDLDYAD